MTALTFALGCTSKPEKPSISYRISSPGPFGLADSPGERFHVIVPTSTSQDEIKANVEYESAHREVCPVPLDNGAQRLPRRFSTGCTTASTRLEAPIMRGNGSTAKGSFKSIEKGELWRNLS